jgi:hypothetical protein
MTENPTKSGSQTRKGFVSFARTYTVSTEAEARSAGALSIDGIPVTDRRWERIQSGTERWRVTVSYEGIDQDQSPEEGSVGIKQVVREEPIEAHPRIEQLKEQYGGTEDDEGNVKFPVRLPEGKGGSGTGFGSRKGRAGRNPMYGMKTFPKRGAEWTRTYFRKSLPSDLLDKAGRTTATLPGGVKAPPGKLWVYGPSEAVEKGASIQITERATLEDEDVAKAIYGTIV